jgi:hypothetical protein
LKKVEIILKYLLFLDFMRFYGAFDALRVNPHLRFYGLSMHYAAFGNRTRRWAVRLYFLPKWQPYRIHRRGQGL